MAIANRLTRDRKGCVPTGRALQARAVRALAAAWLLAACGGGHGGGGGGSGGSVSPAITSQPLPAVVLDGDTATFTVVATGSAPLSHQWRKNAMAIPGATAASYGTPATTLADRYRATREAA